MNSDSADVVVVGASAAGLAVLERLRAQGFTGTVEMIGAEEHLPYDRPPLSKQVLSGRWPADRARLRDPEALDALAARWTLGRRAVRLDVGSRVVELDDGRAVRYGDAVIATGLAPRTPPFCRGLRGVHVLRTLDDAVALRAALTEAQRVVVVGAGVLGVEVAATSRALGHDVTVVDPLPTPMHHQLGPELGQVLAALHTRHGTRLLTGSGVASLVDDAGPNDRGTVTGVALTSGVVLPADVVVVTVGSSTATGWLRGSGVPVRDGVECDRLCRAAEHVWAAGDVARWHHPGLGGSVRLENRTNAVQQAMVVADNVLGAQRPYAPVPSFWTDQYDVRIQVSGTVPPGATVHVVDGDPDRQRFTAVVVQDGTVVGAVGWNDARGYRAALRQLGGRPAVA